MFTFPLEVKLNVSSLVDIFKIPERVPGKPDNIHDGPKLGEFQEI